MEAEINVLMVESNKEDAKVILDLLQNLNGWKINHTLVETERLYTNKLLFHHYDMVVCDWSLPRAKEIYDDLKLDIAFIRIPEQMSREEAEKIVRPAVELSLQTAENYRQMTLAWGKMLEIRDKETQGHSDRVTNLSSDLARALGVREPDIIHIRRGARLHDIGKMAIADSILLKPGPLDEAETDEMRKHVTYGYDVLKQIPFMKNCLDIPLYHHENVDGSGYPRKLRDNEIPLSARIFRVVDTFDALTEGDRPYRKAWTKADALTYLQEQAGRLFDGRVVNVFVRMMESRQ